eukprot:364938-Chlamydomonas_euryale.AAC.30
MSSGDERKQSVWGGARLQVTKENKVSGEGHGDLSQGNAAHATCSASLALRAPNQLGSASAKPAWLCERQTSLAVRAPNQLGSASAKPALDLCCPLVDRQVSCW